MWQCATRFLGKFSTDRNGVTAMLFGIMLLPLLLSVGVAVDYSRALRVKQHLGRALDSAALAIGSWRDLDEAQLKQKAQAFFAANYDAEVLGTPSPLNVSIQGKVITISATSTVDMVLMQLAGFNQISVGALSEITLNEKKIELVMVLDNTGSMGWSGKLTSLKNASNTLLDVLIPDAGGGVSEDVKIGLVPFAAAVNIGSDKLGSGWIDVAAQSSIASEDFQPGTNVLDLYGQIQNAVWNGCVRARPSPLDTQDVTPAGGDTLWPPYFAPDEPDFSSYYNRYASDFGYSGSTYDYDARQRFTGKYNALTISGTSDGPDFNCRTAPVTPLSNTRATIAAAINQMVATGNTVIPAGLAWGWRLISPETPFTEGIGYDDEETIKAVMLLTDGQNSVGGGIGTHNRSQYNAYGFATSGHLGATNGAEAESVLDAKTATLCANIKNKGIRLYTITFQVSSSSTRDLMRNCATETEMYYDSPSGDQLNTIFQDIAKGLADLRISK
ncbi:MAG: pilus assembly protein TadG-related protein [Alphaproteobacteria bacterium]